MIFALALAAAATLATTARAAPLKTAPVLNPVASDTVVYTVKHRDTLYGLCEKYIVAPKRWTALQKLARVGDPHFLPIGRVMVIPRDWLKYKLEPAQLASYRGTIDIQSGGRHTAPVAGMMIAEGTEITTAPNSFATLILTDRSKVAIPSNSKVTVVQLRRIILTGAIDYRVTVGRGKLETRVTPLDNPQGRYRIGTPISMTAVRGTEFRVAFDGDHDTAAAEVLGGTVAVSPAKGGTATPVEHGFGASTDRAGDSKVEPLLPAPDLTDPGKVQTNDTVEFHANPIPGAVRYHVIVATDAGFVGNIAERTADTPEFSLTDIPNGNQFARVSAIAASGLEGLAQSYGFRRTLASIHGEARQEPDGFRFRWFGAGAGKRLYRFQMMVGAPESAPILDEVGLTRTEVMVNTLPAGVYYWRVGLTQIDESGEISTWTDLEKLTIAGPGRGGK